MLVKRRKFFLVFFRFAKRWLPCRVAVWVLRCWMCFFVFWTQKSTSKLLRTDDLFVIKSWIVPTAFLGGWFSVIRENVTLYNTSLHTCPYFWGIVQENISLWEVNVLKLVIWGVKFCCYMNSWTLCSGLHCKPKWCTNDKGNSTKQVIQSDLLIPVGGHLAL